jgi:small subunit ribosomal protein S4
VAAGDTVEVRERSRQQPRIRNAIAMASQVGFPDWVQVDDKNLTGTLRSLPAREDILPDVNENLVVELYSK